MKITRLREVNVKWEKTRFASQIRARIRKSPFILCDPPPVLVFTEKIIFFRKALTVTKCGFGGWLL
ncbi:hypothetical protein AUM89_00305 [Cronobacter sakazakii]|uniref:Uncharacterized protein n=1 Tax=Cronobacter sakazakii TaxID=28141 RepID=A0A7V7USV3_CROSK|nr:hypothetical protein [Cronobacter sakazakii]CCK13098.1 hypothetical protein BN126_3289 [Cronobacter sakazakii 680]EGT4282866.1 hypothetical protein [Cronobacter sakazakii]EGT4291098.1 hypothetical protein [Cronobacter sakazakii]EGT4303835.1 hypothetical protein [Cronobacter sakazakii]